MPRRNGTEPSGQEPGTGLRQGPGRGRMGSPFAVGLGGNCLYLSCGRQVPQRCWKAL